MRTARGAGGRAGSGQGGWPFELGPSWISLPGLSGARLTRVGVRDDGLLGGRELNAGDHAVAGEVVHLAGDRVGREGRQVRQRLEELVVERLPHLREGTEAVAEVGSGPGNGIAARRARPSQQSTSSAARGARCALSGARASRARLLSRKRRAGTGRRARGGGAERGRGRPALPGWGGLAWAVRRAETPAKRASGAKNAQGKAGGAGDARGEDRAAVVVPRRGRGFPRAIDPQARSSTAENGRNCPQAGWPAAGGAWAGPSRPAHLGPHAIRPRGARAAGPGGPRGAIRERNGGARGHPPRSPASWRWRRRSSAGRPGPWGRRPRRARRGRRWRTWSRGASRKRRAAGDLGRVGDGRPHFEPKTSVAAPEGHRPRAISLEPYPGFRSNPRSR